METDAPPSTSLSFPTAGFTNLGDSDAISQMGSIGVARGAKGPWSPKFLENIIILFLERRFSKQNSVIRLTSYILPIQIFCSPQFLRWLRHWWVAAACIRLDIL